ncbi:hypothetical protein MTR67_049776 [Solanum verrucosum]|uniref:Uncharacterized protein n=1 Tax=Solanum verrucosum TaxID=315347 RepID=A0AAF0V3Z0_SOLVR|nr:hypothetical protein KY289_009222 [Solanum tuberosum]KAH0715792.1 hypothetical protein KY284_008697 [Solanum tuberosum]KAH0747079.1 hypothetical protein KY285_008736 [Solanum tuberosum]WMV56391.1 hypothetical protein MTR67_049776 [Solanum verrucosum]
MILKVKPGKSICLEIFRAKCIESDDADEAKCKGLGKYRTYAGGTASWSRNLRLIQGIIMETKCLLVLTFIFTHAAAFYNISVLRYRCCNTSTCLDLNRAAGQSN